MVRRALLVLIAAAAAGLALHCTIDHVPHVYCNSNDDCDPDFVCDPMHHSCFVPADMQSMTDMPTAGPDMFCTGSAECTDSAPICADQRCRACQDSSDDPQCLARDPSTPRCNSPTGECVACLTSADCKNPTPVCNTTMFTCRTCAAHAECASGVCKSDGTCADASDVAYVNNASGSCTDTVHASTPVLPYCQIQYAASNASKAYIVVAGSATAYGALTFSATASAIGPLTIIGPAGRGGATAATLSTSMMPSLLVSTTVSTLNLKVDGLDFMGMGGTTPAVQCQAGAGTATLTIVNSTIRKGATQGVSSSGCVLTLDANIISQNTNEGVNLSSTVYVLTNNIINTNGAAGYAGVSIDTNSTGTFAFNTIASNGGANAFEGGVTCPSAGTTKLLQDSIIAENSHNPTTNGTQFAGKCQLQSVVTGQDTFSGATQALPAFTSDFHLDVSAAGLSANEACCIDKIASATTPNSGHDVDEGNRPKGNGFDTGANEAK